MLSCEGMRIVLEWNGKEIPEQLRRLPEGRYVLESVDDVPEALTAEQERGIREAMASVRAGEAIPADRARRELEAILKK